MRASEMYSFALLTVLLAGACSAQVDFGHGAPKKQLPPAVRSDVKYIKCSACHLFVKNAMRTVKTMREELKPGKKLEEGDIIDKLELLCDAQKPDGEWLRHLDMVEKGDTIELRDMGKMGKHTVETSTIARACTDVSEGLDLSDISEALYHGKSRSHLIQAACHDMSGACNKKPPPVPKGREAGPKFQAMSHDEAEREKLMSKLAASGLGGQMYDRESLQQEMSMMRGGEDVDDDEVDEMLSGGGGGKRGRKKKAAGAGGIKEQLIEKAAAAADAARVGAAKAQQAAAEMAGKATNWLKGAMAKVKGSGAGKQEL